MNEFQGLHDKCIHSREGIRFKRIQKIKKESKLLKLIKLTEEIQKDLNIFVNSLIYSNHKMLRK